MAQVMVGCSLYSPTLFLTLSASLASIWQHDATTAHGWLCSFNLFLTLSSSCMQVGHVPTMVG